MKKLSPFWRHEILFLYFSTFLGNVRYAVHNLWTGMNRTTRDESKLSSPPPTPHYMNSVSLLAWGVFLLEIHLFLSRRNKARSPRCSLRALHRARSPFWNQSVDLSSAGNSALIDPEDICHSRSREILRDNYYQVLKINPLHSLLISEEIV